MAQYVKQGNIFGRIGTGVGQGLAEQVPKEIERSRLQSGLESLEKDSAGLNPFQIATRFAAIPGITPSMVETLTPLLVKEGVRRQGPIDTTGKGGTSTPSQSSVNPVNGNNQPPSANEPSPLPKKGNEEKPYTSTTKPEDVQRNAPKVLDAQQIENEAHQRWNANPTRYPGGLSEAKNEIVQDQNANIQKYNAQETKRNKDIANESAILNNFNTEFQKGLQKSGAGTFADIPGEAQKIFEQQAIDDFEAGKTPEEAGKKAADKALQFAKQRQSLKSIGGSNIFKASPDLVSDLKRIRNAYAEIDPRMLPIFVDDMKVYNGLGDHLASEIAYPMSSGVRNSIPDLNITNRKYVNSDNVIKDITKNFTKNDSIFALASNLESLGYNADEMINKLIKMADNDPNLLTERQRKEASDYYPMDYTLGDVFLSNFTDMFKKEKVSSTEKARRYFWGKR